jgi:hypothetical protein
MIRTAESLRLTLAQSLTDNPQYTRLVKAALVREAARFLDSRGKVRRCRSVREQHRYDTRTVDSLPSWL